jgi:REP element-mobilizing transposase RayT
VEKLCEHHFRTQRVPATDTHDVPVNKPRIEIAGAYYHLGTRGNNRCDIFEDDDDRLVFILMLNGIADRYGWSIVAYCLMTTHYHLVMRIGEAGMARGFCELNGGYAREFNARHGRRNHLFGRRYWDGMIESEGYLLESIRYTVLNPVRAGIAGSPADWRWSSYRACAGLDHPIACLDLEHALGLFNRPHVVAARHAFRRFVHAGLGPRQPTKTKWVEIAT